MSCVTRKTWRLAATATAIAVTFGLGAAAAQPTHGNAPINKPINKPDDKPDNKHRGKHKRATSTAKLASPAPTEGPAYGARADVLAFAQEVTQRHGFEPDWVARQLGRAHKLAAVQRLLMPPPAGTAKNWAAYRARFVEPQRIDAGVQFWRATEAWLARAEERFGVPAEVVVGIVGVETFYGRVMGNFRLIDALATLSFDFPKGRSDRSEFFRGELEELLVLARREKIDPASLRGSFAGAMGLPQFMPGSVNRHALDFDEDGHIDLHGNTADVIGSVARYLAEHGWQRGQPTHFSVLVPVDSADRAHLLAPDILPTFSASQFLQRGAELDADARAHPGLLALVELQNGAAAPSFVAGTANFYAVTRYNRSSYYAMAVIDLGRAVALARASR